jgi:hypothetical protein
MVVCGDGCGEGSLCSDASASVHELRQTHGGTSVLKQIVEPRV